MPASIGLQHDKVRILLQHRSERVCVSHLTCHIAATETQLSYHVTQYSHWGRQSRLTLAAVIATSVIIVIQSCRKGTDRVPVVRIGDVTDNKASGHAIHDS